MKIPFNRPWIPESSRKAVMDATLSPATAQNYLQECAREIKETTQSQAVFLTPSCTSALELAALLLDLHPGDEVIMPSFTFPSTANAFLLRGAIPVFVDIKPDDLNINENLIEQHITCKTRAIVVVHYAGVSCEMDHILSIARAHKLYVIEDAAQAYGTFYKGKPTGSLGDLVAFSFHHTKNIQCGEGGALAINNPAFLNKVEILHEKGTNRLDYLRGTTPYYCWIDLGSSFSLSPYSAALLHPQLHDCVEITEARRELWHQYLNFFESFESTEISRHSVGGHHAHNGHIFYLIASSKEGRNRILNTYAEHGIQASTHYHPLHLAPAASKYSCKWNDLTVTETLFDRLIRLPLWVGLDTTPILAVSDQYL